MEIHTAQLFKVTDSDLIDITVKGGSPFGPEWAWVFGTKDGTMTEEEYTNLYLAKMRKLWKEEPEVFLELLSRDRIVLGCYCKPGVFCHRHILVDILLKIATALDIQATYMGELQ